MNKEKKKHSKNLAQDQTEIFNKSLRNVHRIQARTWTENDGIDEGENIFKIS